MANINLLRASVGHKRLWPRENAFVYKVFYLDLPLDASYEHKPRLFSHNRFNVFSVFDKDHGAKEQKVSWLEWFHSELTKANVPLQDDYSYRLICHPRLFGYAFNPISYWLVLDDKGRLRALLCEVHNTFKDTHNYLLAKKDHSPIKSDDVLSAQKHLYVSPYNKVRGHYTFKHSYSGNTFKSVIDYFDQGRHVLNTYVGGVNQTLSDRAIVGAVLRYPFMTVLVVARIHWQALVLFVKRVPLTLKTRNRAYKSGKTTVARDKRKS